MRNRTIIALCLVIVIPFVLAGCRLAREDAGEDDSRARLIGVLITDEYLDLFDMDSYLSDNISKIMKGGGNFTVGTKDNKYQGRLFATLSTRFLTSEATGEEVEIQEYVFDGVKGIPFYNLALPGDKNTTFSPYTDGAISDIHVNISSLDDENKTSLEGTIYVSPDPDGRTFYLNPVYQDEDGSVFAVSGTGVHIRSDQRAEAAISHTHTLEETISITENGKSKSSSFSVKISIATIFPPKRIAILQMDKDSMVLSRIEYKPGELPNSLTPEADADYIIVETHKLDRKGNPAISRTLFDKSNQSIETFYCREDGICAEQHTKVNW